VTDRQRILITIPRVSVLTRDKMYPLCNNKSWDLLLISVIIELATSNLVHNFRFAQYAVKTTFRSKIAEGAGLGEHNKNFGTPLQLLNLTTSFLVHNLDLGSGLPKSFRTKIGEIWVKGSTPKIWSSLLIFVTIETAKKLNRVHIQLYRVRTNLKYNMSYTVLSFCRYSLMACTSALA